MTLYTLYAKVENCELQRATDRTDCTSLQWCSGTQC